MERARERRGSYTTISAKSLVWLLRQRATSFAAARPGSSPAVAKSVSAGRTRPTSAQYAAMHGVTSTTTLASRSATGRLSARSAEAPMAEQLELWPTNSSSDKSWDPHMEFDPLTATYSGSTVWL